MNEVVYFRYGIGMVAKYPCELLASGIASFGALVGHPISATYFLWLALILTTQPLTTSLLLVILESE